MTFLSLRETLPKTLQIDFFPCRRSFEWETRSFQYFSFLFRIYIKTKQGLSSNVKKKWGCLPKKEFFLLPCVRFALLMSFSQLWPRVKPPFFIFFSFLFLISIKTEQGLSSNGKKKVGLSTKRKVSLLPCVCFALLMSFSQLWQHVKPPCFNFFHFFFVYTYKQSRNYLVMAKTSGVVSPPKKLFYCLVCIFLY